MEKLFALVDANCFYASCERIFDPSLRGKALVVLSNNDGCAITRSDEAKDLGVKMAAPYFKLRAEFGDELICKSSNYALYGEVSRRFHELLSWYAAGQEIYSIDESFLDVSMVHDVEYMMKQIFARCHRDLSLPVCVGVGSTKTRAKLANHFAKKYNKNKGRYNLEDLSASEEEKLLKKTSIGDLWGIGKGHFDALYRLGIQSIWDLKNADHFYIRKKFSVVLQKTVLELNGESCLELEELEEPRKQIMTSRSFGEMTDDVGDLRQALTFFCTLGGEKLRKQKSRASTLSVFIKSNRFREDLSQYGKSYTLSFPVPTDDTTQMIHLAFQALMHIYKPGILYKKAGILLGGLESGEFEQINIFGEQAQISQKKLMQTLDTINTKFGNNTMMFASQGFHNTWKMRSAHKSPSYLHSWDGVPKCH